MEAGGCGEYLKLEEGRERERERMDGKVKRSLRAVGALIDVCGLGGGL